MGVAQGAQLREKIAAAGGLLSELEAFRLKKPWWMPYGVYCRLAQQRALKYLQAPFSGPFAEAGERLAGIAEGAGCDLGALYLLNALEPVLSSVEDSTAVAASGACSAVAVRGRRSATGEPVIVRNFDYLPLVQPLYVLRDSRPVNGSRWVDFTIAPLCGTVDGMNEHGLSITYNYAYATDAGPAGVPISVVLAEALQRCTRVAEAADWITSRPRWGAGLLMLADPSGDIAALELSNTRSCLHRPSGDEDVLFHSNCYRTAEMRKIEVAGEVVYTRRAPTPLRGRRVLQSSEVRDERFVHLLTKTARFGPDELACLMADHGPAGRPDADTICMHSSYWNTTACLQFYPCSRRIRVAYDFACSARYAELEL